MTSVEGPPLAALFTYAPFAAAPPPFAGRSDLPCPWGRIVYTVSSRSTIQ